MILTYYGKEDEKRKFKNAIKNFYFGGHFSKLITNLKLLKKAKTKLKKKRIE